MPDNPPNVSPNVGGGGVVENCSTECASAALNKIKLIIKTSILPPTPTACAPSIKRIQKFLNGGDSSFEQSMEFKPINAATSQLHSIRRFSEQVVAKSTDTAVAAVAADDDDNDLQTSRCLSTTSTTVDEDDTPAHTKDNDTNLNRRIVGQVTQIDMMEVDKEPKKLKLDNQSENSPVTLTKSSSSTSLLESKTSITKIRCSSLTPSPSLFRKTYSAHRWRRKNSVVQDKLVLPTILITSTPIKDSLNSLYGEEESMYSLSPLSRENMQIFESQLGSDELNANVGEDFSFICEPAESVHGGDTDEDVMETSATSHVEFQPPLEPVFNAEPLKVSISSVKNDAALLKRCQGGRRLVGNNNDHNNNNNNCRLSPTGETDVPASLGDAPGKRSSTGSMETDKPLLISGGNNKENEFLAPNKKCSSNSKRVKSATVRVLHALTAKSLADDIIETNSPFRRYGGISSSFRSQLTALEAKKMITGSGSGPKVPTRPRSFASSEGDVNNKTEKPSEAASRKGSVVGNDKKTRVLEWNSSFEVLLEDIYGVHALAEFLRKEFSAENIYFWTACERYKQLKSVAERYQEAQQIFARHLENGAPEPVNIDSRATTKTQEQLQLANVDLFDAAQKQIFNLMKFDSYARFIKSDIYKQCLDCEMKKLPPPYPESRVLDPALACTSLASQGVHSLSPSKLKKSVSNAEDRRRKSLLPWHRKTRSKSKDRNEERRESNHIYSSRSSLSSFDAVLESPQSQHSQLARVILANGATTIVQTRATETIRELVLRLLEKRGLTYTSFEVYTGESNKPLDLEAMSTRIAGKQARIEQRVTFKLDLPNKKVISVKSKPEKILEDVLRPILYKYQFSLDNVRVRLRDEELDLVKGKPVTEVDGRRLVITNSKEEPSVKPTLHEITNQQQQVSVKALTDYMNCRFAGQQIVDNAFTRKNSTEDNGKSVIAKWSTTGAKLQSPSRAGVDSSVCPREYRNPEAPTEMPDRPTPAPRLSITKNALQTSTSSMNNSHDSGILSNRTTSSNGDHSLSNAEGRDFEGSEMDHIKAPPPPLPPKPKVLPIKGPNWSGNKNIYLDQPTSSFV